MATDQGGGDCAEGKGQTVRGRRRERSTGTEKEVLFEEGEGLTKTQRAEDMIEGDKSGKVARTREKSS